MARCKTAVLIKRPFRKLKKNKSVIIPNWKILDSDSPYYNSDTNRYYVTIESKEASLGNEGQTARIRNNARSRATDAFLKVFYKNDSSDNRLKISDALKVEELYVPERPNANCITDSQELEATFGVKALVSVDADVLDAVPYIKTKKREEPLPLAHKEITFVSSQMRNGVRALAQIIKDYADSAEQHKGRITGINLKKEAERVEQSYSAMENLFIANGLLIPEGQDDLIIIGITNKYEPLYVVYDSGEFLIRLDNGFESYKGSTSMSDDRVVAFLSQIGEISKLGQKETPIAVMDFLKEYGSDREPVIDFGDISIGPKRGTSYFKNKKHYNKENIDDIDEFIKKTNKKSVKTDKELKQEDEVLESGILQDHIHTKEYGRFDFVGEAKLSVRNMDDLINSVHSLEDVFDEVLNKINIKTLIELAIKCLPSDPCVIAKMILINMKCEEFLKIYSSEIGIRILDIPEIQETVKANIKKCIPKYSDEEREIIIGRIEFKSGIVLDAKLTRLDLIPLDVIIDAMGSQGQRFLEEICDDKKFRKKLVDDIPDDICYKLNLELPKFPKIVPPTISFKDFAPTIDIMSSITATIDYAILEALIMALVQFIKDILRGILENCGDLSDVRFGKINFDKLLADTLSLDVDFKAFANFKANLIENFGLVANVENVDIFGNQLSFLLDDVSALLSPSEMSNLLNGKVDGNVNDVINCLIKTKYTALQPAMNSPSKKEDMFETLGGFINKQPLLDQITTRRQAIFSSDVFCDPQDNQFKRKLLEDKGLTPTQIDEQLLLAKNAKRERLKELLDLYNKDDILKDVLPPVFCDSSNSGGLVSKNHESVMHVLNMMADTTYDGVNISFNQDISNFSNAIKDSTRVTVPKIIFRKVEFTTEDGDTTDIENSEYRRLLSTGMSVKDPEDLDGPPVVLYEELEVDKKFVLKGLRDNFSSIETDKSLIEMYPRLVKFKIPSDINASQLAEQSAGLNSNQGIFSEEIKAAIEKAKNTSFEDLAVVENVLGYELPEEPVPGKDIYSITVTSKTSQNSTEEAVFRIDREVNIPDHIQAFISNNRLDARTGGGIPQRVTFSNFVKRIYENGYSVYRGKDKLNFGKPNLKIDSILSISNKMSQVHMDMFTEILSSFARKAANSPLFVHKNLNLVDFTPEKEDGSCQSGLLRLEDTKGKLKDAFKKCSDDGISPSGNKKETYTEAEKEGFNGAALVLIRICCIEQVLKSIFVLTETSVSSIEDVDDTLVVFLIREIKLSLQKLSSASKDLSFIEEYSTVIVNYYNELFPNEPVNSFDDAVSYFIKDQLNSVIQDISTLVKGRRVADFNKSFISQMVPVFDVQNQQGESRFGSVTKVITHMEDPFQLIPYFDIVAENVSFKENISYRKVLFSFENGNFILERYIRPIYKNEKQHEQEMSTGMKINENLNSARINSVGGVHTFSGMEEFMNTNIKEKSIGSSRTENISDTLDSWAYGLRLVYVLPLSEFGSSGGDMAYAYALSELGTSWQMATQYEKIFKQQETVTLKRKDSYIDQSTGEIGWKITDTEQTTRDVYSIPLVGIEITEDGKTLDTVFKTGVFTTEYFSNRWRDNSEELYTKLLETDEYKFLFNYSVPINRMNSLLAIYSMMYVSNMEKAKDLFSGSKMAAKSAFQALLNSGNYKYQDSNIKNRGGNFGINVNALNNVNTEPDTTEAAAKGMANKTPILILKGITELTDSVIEKAKKTVDKARAAGVSELTMLAAVMSQLPMNIFPPPPVGPGKGPPLSSLGFLYLALNAYEVFESMKNKQDQRVNVSSQFDIQYGKLQTNCADTEDEGEE